MIKTSASWMAVLLLSTWSPRAEAQAPCPLDWSDGFGYEEFSGALVYAMSVFDAGSGPALIAGGNFTHSTHGVPLDRLARWDGTRWNQIAPGFLGGYVTALETFDDGSGPALYVAGDGISLPSPVIHDIARWNGTTWSNLAGGMNGPTFALAVHDDGFGPALYAAGEFTLASGLPAKGVARWTGSGWERLDGGVAGRVYALASYDDGNGQALYAGGDLASGAGIVRWSEGAWSTVGGGVGGAQPIVHALRVHDDGGGPRLYAGGAFTLAGGSAVDHVARWNGSAWSAVGTGFDGAVRVLATHAAPSGTVLVAGGEFGLAGASFVNHVAQWDGSAWSPVGGGTSSVVHALATFNELGGGNALFAGGLFGEAGAAAAISIARWDGAQWTNLTPGRGLAEQTSVFQVWDDGSGAGPALYVGGSFNGAGDAAAKRIGRWDGARWSALGEGIPGPGYVGSLQVFDDGSGPALYAMGAFQVAGGQVVNSVARWNGASWSGLNGGVLNAGINGQIHASAVFDDGSGPALYVFGNFTSAGGVPAVKGAKWDGSTWSEVPMPANFNHNYLSSAAVFDAGSGAELYLSWDPASLWMGAQLGYVARFDGTTWSSAASGINGPVYEMGVHDFGSGSALYVLGAFQSAGGNPARAITRFDGVSWSALGAGLTGVPTYGGGAGFAAAVHDAGDGPALYVAGAFTTAGGVSAANVARWDGSSWSPLGAGFPESNPYLPYALVSFDDGSGGGPALYAGGAFRTVSNKFSMRIAKWSSDCSATGVPFCFGDGSATPCPCGNDGAPGNGCASSVVPVGANLGGYGTASVASDALVIVGSSMPDSSVTYFQGTTQPNFSNGNAFGDGLVCVGGALIRLGTKFNVQGQSQYPVAGDLSIALKGLIPAGGGVTRMYQARYRNNDPSFCTADTFNYTNGLRIVWLP